MAKQWRKKENMGKKENIVEKTKEILGRGINKAADFGFKCLKKISDTANNINKSTAKTLDHMFNPNNKNKTNSNKTNKTNYKIKTTSKKGNFGNMVDNVVVGAKKIVNNIAPLLATEGSIEKKVTDTINVQGMEAAINGVRNDCLKNPNSKQCKVGTRTINNRIEQANLQKGNWGR